MASLSTKRATAEFRKLSANLPPGVLSAEVCDDDIRSWRVVVTGPVGSPYAGGKFAVTVAIPEDYPHVHPTLRFVTKLYNPGVNAEGEVCSGLFEDWAPTMSVETALATVMALFSDYSRGTMNEEAAKKVHDDPAAFAAVAKEWTARHAQ